MVRVLVCVALIMLGNVAMAQMDRDDLFWIIVETSKEKAFMETSVSNAWVRSDVSQAVLEFDMHETSKQGYHVAVSHRMAIAALQLALSQSKSSFESQVTLPSETAPNVCYITKEGVLVRRHDPNVGNVSVRDAASRFAEVSMEYAIRCLDADEGFDASFDYVARAAVEIAIIELYCEEIDTLQNMAFAACFSVMFLEFDEYSRFGIPESDMGVGALIIHTLP